MQPGLSLQGRSHNRSSRAGLPVGVLVTLQAYVYPFTEMVLK